MVLTWIDNTIIAIFIFSVVVGLIRGFLKEMLSVLIWALAFILATRFSVVLGQTFTLNMNDEAFRILIWFCIVVFATLLVGAVISYGLNLLLIKSGLNATNRFFGVLFGLTRGFIIIVGLMLLVQLTSVPKTEGWKKSILMPHFLPAVTFLKTVLPNHVGGYFNFKGLDDKYYLHYIKR